MIILGAYPSGVSQVPGNGIHSLLEFLSGWTPSDIGVHLLPFYPDCGDGGFACIDWTAVDPAHGRWSDVKALAERHYLIVDAIYNHVGVGHPFFLAFLRDPEAWGHLFYAYRQEAPPPAPPSPRGGPAIRPWKVNRETWHLWQTFNNEVVDLRLDRSEVVEEIKKHLEVLALNRVAAVRIDAPAYFGKRLGGPARHSEESYRLARFVADLVSEAGLDIFAQLDCDLDAQQYFPPSAVRNVPIIDFSFSAQLALALLRETTTFLAEHLQTTSRIGNLLVRCPRTHDGILMKSAFFPTPARDLLASTATALGISVRVIDGFPYELNCSLPYLYGKGVSRATRDARLQLAWALSCFLPGHAYIYLPALVGFEPDEIVSRSDDPRSLNRTELREYAAREFLASPFGLETVQLMKELAALQIPITARPSVGASALSARAFGSCGLFLSMAQPARWMALNFSANQAVQLPVNARSNIVCARRMDGSALAPLGFAVGTA